MAGFITKIAAATIKWLFIYSLASFYGSINVAILTLQTIFNPFKWFWYVKKRETPPDCLKDPVHGEHHFIQLKDVKLHYVEKGDKSKPLMLFIHGFPEFWYSWRYQMAEFSNNYWVVSFDMRGYGDSEKPEGRDKYSLKYLVEDVKQLIEALGREKCIVVAHDWGGAVAWRFILDYPNMVESYIIMDCPYPARFMATWKQFFMSWYIFFFQLPYLPEIMLRSYDMRLFRKAFIGDKPENCPITDEDIEAYKYTFGKPGAFTPPLNYYREMFKGRPKRSEKLISELPEGLLIFAEHDDYLERRHVHVAKKIVKNLKTEIINDANHFVQQHRPKEVNKAMSDFLRGVLPLQ